LDEYIVVVYMYSPAQNSCSHIQEINPHFIGPIDSLWWSQQFASGLANESEGSIPKTSQSIYL